SEERTEIEAEIAHYEQKQAACIEAMKIVQKHRGWLSDDGIRDVAEIMDMTPAELDSVATFYNLLFRQPVGRHVVMVCDSVSCWIMGYEKIRQYLMDKLGVGMGETTPDGRFTLLPICCLGNCDRAPAMMVGEDLHQDLTPEKIDAILEKYA
ncbi:MAG: NADH-quinone oxidoreductase subunit NuoE, partial [Candidatus Omnitrophica bacterium]|nr:NADH-quinone oxidoreductase subunit NuoE [Candidatus Omnitrophota bacterium]